VVLVEEASNFKNQGGTKLNTEFVSPFLGPLCLCPQKNKTQLLKEIIIEESSSI
jgi:hypothetical protein